jgi:hypothetical protein
MGLVEQTKIILGGLEFKKRGATEGLPNRKSTPFSLSKHSTPHISTHCPYKMWRKKTGQNWVSKVLAIFSHSRNMTKVL